MQPIKHIGFAGAERKVEGEGYSPKVAGKIIGAASRNASPAAKKANPRLKRVSAGPIAKKVGTAMMQGY